MVSVYPGCCFPAATTFGRSDHSTGSDFDVEDAMDFAFFGVFALPAGLTGSAHVGVLVFMSGCGSFPAFPVGFHFRFDIGEFAVFLNPFIATDFTVEGA